MSNRANYYDTSAILAMLFHQAREAEVLELWDSDVHRVSSYLSAFECFTVNHRASLKLPKPMQANWQKDSFKWLDAALRSISLHEINETVLTRLRREHLLGKARTLDAVHLATALVFRDAGIDTHIVSTDKKMRALARDFDFVILPLSRSTDEKGESAV